MSVSEENTGEVVYGPTILDEAKSGVPSPSPCTAEIQEEADLQENVDPEEDDKHCKKRTSLQAWKLLCFTSKAKHLQF